MARTVTATAVKRIISKGLTGWQAGKLALQDLVDSCLGSGSVLTEADLAGIERLRLKGADVQDYNMFMGLCRGFYRGYMVAEWARKDACLQIAFLDDALKDAETRRTVQLFESLGPRMVTRRQYEEIVAAQREKKLAFEFDLSYVIEERFYAIASPEARAATDEAVMDIESMGDFLAAVPDIYADLCNQAIDQIRRIYADGKLSVLYADADAKEVKRLLRRWKKDELSLEEVIKLVDRLSVTGQALYDCSELPEWKSFIERYQQHWLDDDERFRHVYAVVEDCPEVWLDQQGHYKAPTSPSEYITRTREALLGLIGHGAMGRSVDRVGAALRDQLHTAEQNVRLFLAICAVLDTAANAVGLELPRDAGVLAGENMRLDAYIKLYNLRREPLTDGSRASRYRVTRLEKALQMLPAIDMDALGPNPESLSQLRADILDGARGEEWLPTKIRSLVCGDGTRFNETMN